MHLANTPQVYAIVGRRGGKKKISSVSKCTKGQTQTNTLTNMATKPCVAHSSDGAGQKSDVNIGPDGDLVGRYPTSEKVGTRNKNKYLVDNALATSYSPRASRASCCSVP